MQYTITYDYQGATGGNGSPTYTVTYGNSYTLAVPTRTGHTFGGWYSAANGVGTQYTNTSGASMNNWNETSGRTLYAKWVGLSYSISNGTATVTGIGTMTDTSIVIPSTVAINGTTYSVTAIGNSAFANQTALSQILIPASVTSIGNDAFEFCSSLTNINIPSSVTSIGESAFKNCSGLESITVESGNSVYKSEGNCLIKRSDNKLLLGCNTSVIPNYVTSIAANAFYDCNGLTSVLIPNSVSNIGNNAFYGCSGLTTIYFEGESLDEWNTINNSTLPSVTHVYCYSEDPPYVEYYWRYVNGIPKIWIVKTVTFNKQDGTGGSDSVTATVDAPMPISTAPTRTGLVFGGYYSQPFGGGTKYYNADMTSANNYGGDATLYAKWTATVYLQLYSGPNGTITLTVVVGTYFPNIGLQYLPGYTLDGFYSEPNGGGTQYYDNNMMSNKIVSESIRLYAKWIPNTYSITYRDVGNTAFSGTHGSGYPTSHTYGTTTNLVSPIKTGYTFDGWFENSNGTGTAITSLFEEYNDIILYAKWTLNTYSINYRDAGDLTFSGIHGSGYPTSHTYGTTTNLVSPTKTGYIFVGWFTSRNGRGTSITSISATGYTSNITLYAKWIDSVNPIWDGSIANSFAGGDGTQSNPYRISTGSQLARMASEINAGRGLSSWYVLINDITLNYSGISWQYWDRTPPANTWTPIGNSFENSFKGVLNGNGFAITGIYTNSATQYAGLFGYVISGTIINLGIGNSFILGATAGSIAAYCNGKIINCCNNGSVKGSNYTGGIVGSGSGIIMNNYNFGVVSGNYRGGIVGGGGSGIAFNYFLITVNTTMSFSGIGTVSSSNRTFVLDGTLTEGVRPYSPYPITIGGVSRTTLIDALNAAIDTVGILPPLPTGLSYLRWRETSGFPMFM